MMPKLLLILSLVFMLSSCSDEQPVADSPTKGLTLKQTSFSDLQDFENDDMLGAYSAFIKSCSKILTQKGPVLGNSAIKINLADYQKICSDAQGILPAKFKDFIKNNFTPYLVSYDNNPQGKFTSYYESTLNASFTKDNVYKYPVYGRPHDLIEINLRDFDASLPNKKIVGRVKDRRLIPYYSRADINQHGIDAPVILWADSYIDIYVMQIQGSAVALMNDGSQVRISFAESNGRPFKGIGSILLQKGLIGKGQASMGKIKQWLKENPDLAQQNMDENERYIFHRIANTDGPIGAQGVSLTAGRSLAVDKSIVPLGALLWLETSKPDGTAMNKLVVAQDIGSAIKGAVRGDYFWGSGGDDVLELAGKMNSKGQYFILIPNKTEDLNGQAHQ